MLCFHMIHLFIVSTPFKIASLQDDPTEQMHKNIQNDGSDHACVCLSDLFSKAMFDEPEEASEETVWANLHRLLVNLRVGDGLGCDSSLIKSHRSCRKLSHGRNWHQSLEHLRRVMNLKSGLSAHRTSRTAAWKTLSATAMKKHFGLDESRVPHTLSCGNVVLVLSPTKPVAWRVGVLLSLWYMRGKKARPSHLPVSIDKVKTIRVALMRPVQGLDEGRFIVDQDSDAVSCAPFRIATMLTCLEKRPSHESFECSLSDESLEIVQQAHKLHWPKHLLHDDPRPCATFLGPSSPARSPKKPSGSSGTKTAGGGDKIAKQPSKASSKERKKDQNQKEFVKDVFKKRNKVEPQEIPASLLISIISNLYRLFVLPAVRNDGP